MEYINKSLTIKLLKIAIQLMFLLCVLPACRNGAKDDHPGATTKRDSVVTVSAASDIVQLEKQVMTVHDETMKSMDSIMMLKNKFKNMMDGKTGIHLQNDTLKAIINRLQRSENSMMDWMSQYNKPDNNANHDQALTYLNEQLKKIREVKIQIEKSFQISNNLLSKSKNNK